MCTWCFPYFLWRKPYKTSIDSGFYHDFRNIFHICRGCGFCSMLSACLNSCARASDGHGAEGAAAARPSRRRVPRVRRAQRMLWPGHAMMPSQDWENMRVSIKCGYPKMDGLYKMDDFGVPRFMANPHMAYWISLGVLIKCWDFVGYIQKMER